MTSDIFKNVKQSKLIRRCYIRINKEGSFGIATISNSIIICLIFIVSFFRPQLAGAEKADIPGKNYNVVLIVVDALRADHLGCYGYFRKDISPSIDILAHKGILFSHAYSQGTWTLPSIASMLTSKYVFQHGVFNSETKLEEKEITLAEILRIFGYNTAAFTSGFFLNKQYNLCQGFDVYEDIPFSLDSHGPTPSKKHIKEMLPNIITWLETMQKKKFFLFLHIMDVHPPLYLPSDGDVHIFDPHYKGIADDLFLDGKLKKYVYDNIVFQADGAMMFLQQRDIEHIISHYDACIQYTDRYVGKILEELKKRGLMDNSIIILTADHGIDLFDYKTLFNYDDLAPYEKIIHVPLIISHPDFIQKEKVISTSVASIDILPTILAFLGLPSKEGASGMSLIPLIEGKKKDFLDRFIYSTSGPVRNKFLWRCASAIMLGNWKLITHPVTSYYAIYELYNTKIDPEETKDKINQRTQVKIRLISELKNLLKNYENVREINR